MAPGNRQCHCGVGGGIVVVVLSVVVVGGGAVVRSLVHVGAGPTTSVHSRAPTFWMLEQPSVPLRQQRTLMNWPRKQSLLLQKERLNEPEMAPGRRQNHCGLGACVVVVEVGSATVVVAGTDVVVVEGTPSQVGRGPRHFFLPTFSLLVHTSSALSQHRNCRDTPRWQGLLQWPSLYLPFVLPGLRQKNLKPSACRVVVVVGDFVVVEMVVVVTLQIPGTSSDSLKALHCAHHLLRNCTFRS